jgi:hypothetical protein
LSDVASDLGGYAIQFIGIGAQAGLGALDVTLTAEQIATLDAVSKPPLSFPAGYAQISQMFGFPGTRIDGVQMSPSPMLAASATCGLSPIRGTSEADGSFLTISVGIFQRWIQEITRSMPIVLESEEIPEPPNFSLKSKAMRIGRSGRRKFLGQIKFCANKSIRYIR